MMSAMNRMSMVLTGSFPRVLLGVVHGARLADHGDANLTGVFQLLLDAPGDLACQVLRARVVHSRVLHQDADLAARLDGVRLLDAWKRVRDSLQRLETLDVDLDALAPGSGARARESVRRRDQHAPEA